MERMRMRGKFILALGADALAKPLAKFTLDIRDGDQHQNRQGAHGRRNSQSEAKRIRLRYQLPIFKNMGTHMKTTIEISDSLYIEAKRRAAKNGTTLRAVIEQGLKLALKQPVAGAGYQPRDCRVKGDGRVEAARASGWRTLREIANER